MTTHHIEAYFREHRRLLAVLMLVIFMTAVSGAFVGMRQTAVTTADRDENTPTHHPVPTQSEVPTAPKYGEIRQAEWLANNDWNFTLQQLPQANESRQPEEPLTAKELVEVLEGRAARRAFDGAPPTIPHHINTFSSASCISCHDPEAKILIGGKRPAAMSHPYYANCTQCHVPGDGLRHLTEDRRLDVASSFQGRSSAGPGCRAYAGAPPTTPHAVHMRQNCMSCHGPDRPNAIRSSHPQRQNCLQCHAQNADYDNRERALESSPPLEP